MIPKTIHQVWIGSVSNMPIHFIQNCVNTKEYCLKNGYEYMIWDDFQISLLLVKNGNKNLFDRIKTVVEKTDFARLLILQEKGGLYIDMDVDIHKDISPLFECKDSFVAKEDETRVCSAVIGSIPNGNYINDVLSGVNYKVIDNGGMWILRLLSEKIKTNQFVTVFPTDYFYPYSWAQTDESKMIPTENTYLIHRWAKSWWEKTT
jgi:mannosyltransferase OCH1-like enzyme